MTYATGALSLAALQRIEAATLALLDAVRSAQGDLSPGPNAPPPSPLPAPTGCLPVATVADVVNAFLTAKARSGRSGTYLRLLLSHCTAFARGREGRPIGSITGAEIEAWAHGQDWQPKTVRGALMAVRTLFAFAVARGYVAANVARSVDLPMAPERPPAVHTPAEVARVLAAAADDPDARRCLAVRYFAGLRRSEAVALAESEILLDRGYIEVTAEKSKTRKRRLVPIQPALRAWLDLGGQLPLRQFNNRLNWVTEASGVACPQNVCRHSFVTYAVPIWGASQVALWAGHTEQVLFNHYRELVTAETAKEFWALRPQTSA